MLTKCERQNDKRGNYGESETGGESFGTEIKEKIRNIRNTVQKLPKKENEMGKHEKIQEN